MIPVLLLIGICLFGVTSVVNRAYERRRRALADEWFSRGQQAMEAANPAAAIADYRNALSYAEETQQYDLRLAQALAASDRTNEALSYFLNLWDRQPGNGLLNLEIARLQARKQNVPEAVRYFHGAIDGRWDSDADTHRRAARLELIHFLLQKRETNQAQSELIALVGNLPSDPELRSRVAQLFLRTGSYERALNEAREALRRDRHNRLALATAGDAAFQLRQYRTAQSFLKSAVAEDPQDAGSRQLLETADLVLTTDPYQPRLTSAEQTRRVLQAFHQAGKRLQECAQLKGIVLNGPAVPSGTPGANTAAAGSSLEPVYTQWVNLQPKMRERMLRRDSDLRVTAMDVVFQIEKETEKVCGTPSGMDLALLLIARNHETAR